MEQSLEFPTLLAGVNTDFLIIMDYLQQEDLKLHAITLITS